MSPLSTYDRFTLNLLLDHGDPAISRDLAYGPTLGTVRGRLISLMNRGFVDYVFGSRPRRWFITDAGRRVLADSD